MALSGINIKSFINTYSTNKLILHYPSQLQVRGGLPERGPHRHRVADDRSLPGLHGRHHPLHPREEAVRTEHLQLPGIYTGTAIICPQPT